MLIDQLQREIKLAFPSFHLKQQVPAYELGSLLFSHVSNWLFKIIKPKRPQTLVAVENLQSGKT